MQRLSITTAMRSLKSNKSYIFYSIAYGLSSLILPFGIQFLVNNLALSGIWLNTVSFLVLIGLGLVISQIVRHSQVILIEFLEREVFIEGMRKWKNFNNEKYAQYLEAELFQQLSFFSKASADSKLRWEVTSKEFDGANKMAVAEKSRWAQGASDLFLVNMREQDVADVDTRRWTALYDYHQYHLDARLFSGKILSIQK